MKTKCYAIGCKLHPLHEARHDVEWYTGFGAGKIIMPKFNVQGIEVSCLKPESDFFDEYDVNPEDFEFPITAYGDGLPVTFAREDWGDVEAICGNEEYEE